MVTPKGPIIKSWSVSLYQAVPAGCRLPCDSLFSSLLWFTTNCCCCIHCGWDLPSLLTARTSSSLLKLSLSLKQSFKGAGGSLFRAAFLSHDPGELAADRGGWGAGCFGRGWPDCDDLCAGSCWDFRTNHKTYEALHALSTSLMLLFVRLKLGKLPLSFHVDVPSFLSPSQYEQNKKFTCKLKWKWRTEESAKLKCKQPASSHSPYNNASTSCGQTRKAPVQHLWSHKNTWTCIYKQFRLLLYKK